MKTSRSLLPDATVNASDTVFDPVLSLARIDAVMLEPLLVTLPKLCPKMTTVSNVMVELIDNRNTGEVLAVSEATVNPPIRSYALTLALLTTVSFVSSVDPVLLSNHPLVAFVILSLLLVARKSGLLAA